jgi:hypothetical protein
VGRVEARRAATAGSVNGSHTESAAELRSREAKSPVSSCLAIDSAPAEVIARTIFAHTAPKSTAITAKLTGVDTIVALGVTTVSTTPVLTLCAELVAAGINPESPLAVYRGEKLTLTVRSIGEAARLVITGKGSGFAVRTAPLVRQNGSAGTGGADHA